MNHAKFTEKGRVTCLWHVPVSVVLLSFLSACADGTTSDATSSNATGSTAVAGPSVSAAQLSNDASYSIAFAQAVAAGDIEAPDPLQPASANPNIGAANPDTTEPTDTPDNAVSVPSVENSEQEESSSGTDTNSETSQPNSETTSNSDSESDTDSTTESNPDALQLPEEPSSTGEDTGTEPDAGVSEEAPPTTEFFSATTPGFNGEILDDSIRVTWPVDPNARGYNVYRQAQFVTSVFTEEYIDEDVFDRDYYYEIQAFDNSDTLYYVATGLTVKARTFGHIDPEAPVPNNNLLDDYQLVFSDEFNGDSLDTSKWNTAYLWGTDLVINSEEQYYVDIANEPDFGFNPFTFDGNNLTINSIETPPELASKSLNQPYLSGVITSYDAFKFTYGYVETRAKVTFGRGYWPAFWLLNAYYVDDKPEIDIMEFIGNDQDVVYHTYHYYDSEGQLRSTESKPTPGVDYTSDFHTYGVEWKPGTLIFYINNVEVHRVTDAKVSQQEMYVIANTALGGWWAGSPDATTPFPGKYTLDYIRVYQKTTPYDDVLLDDGLTQVPYADDIIGRASPSHRPSIEDWPEGYPDGL
ncbi:MAG: family 16 glycosylhydrolase [Granulosicoccus sp.]